MTSYFNHTILIFPLSLVLRAATHHHRHVEHKNAEPIGFEGSALTFHYPIVESSNAAALRLFEGRISFIRHHDTAVNRAGFLERHQIDRIGHLLWLRQFVADNFCFHGVCHASILVALNNRRIDCARPR